MTVKCNRCDKVVPVEDYDEFTPTDQEYGLEITPSILDGDKTHIWKEKNGNLYIHYPKGDES